MADCLFVVDLNGKAQIFFYNEIFDTYFVEFKREIDACEWQYCRIHPTVEIPDEWYKEVE